MVAYGRLSPQIKPNYIQPSTHRDYIKEETTNEHMVSAREKREESDQNTEQLYSELQTPVLLIVLYFLFQLPILRKILFQYLPILFGTDGNININGLGFMSLAFGGCYYLLNKLMMTI